VQGVTDSECAGVQQQSLMNCNFVPCTPETDDPGWILPGVFTHPRQDLCSMLLPVLQCSHRGYLASVGSPHTVHLPEDHTHLEAMA
jgi:hypothetical protein